MRRLLNLQPHHLVTENGVEKTRDPLLRKKLYADYNSTSLSIRLEPDYIVTTEKGSWFVEVKKRSQNLEVFNFILIKYILYVVKK